MKFSNCDNIGVFHCHVEGGDIQLSNEHWGKFWDLLNPTSFH
jgi:hypothetical protein